MSRPYHPQIGPAESKPNRICRGKPSHRLRQWVIERDGGRCLECGTDKDLTMDHIWPAACGGTDWASNLRTLCQSCNSRRHGQWVREHGWTFWPQRERQYMWSQR